MVPIDLIILNLEEIRRRSLKLWSGITPDMYFWKPDKEAIPFLEMVRHILETEHLYQQIIKKRGSVPDYTSPWNDRPYTNLEDELAFSAPYRKEFMAFVQSFTAEDLETIEIIRPERNQRRRLGDFLLRVAYHESVHTGQFLSYFRTYGVDRPMIWD